MEAPPPKLKRHAEYEQIEEVVELPPKIQDALEDAHKEMLEQAKEPPREAEPARSAVKGDL